MWTAPRESSLIFFISHTRRAGHVLHTFICIYIYVCFVFTCIHLFIYLSIHTYEAAKLFTYDSTSLLAFLMEAIAKRHDTGTAYDFFLPNSEGLWLALAGEDLPGTR